MLPDTRNNSQTAAETHICLSLLSGASDVVRNRNTWVVIDDTVSLSAQAPGIAIIPTREDVVKILG